MARTVSPQIEQNPIKAEAVCIGGNSSAGPPNGVAGSAGSWCYDDVGTAGLKRLIAQSIDAGVEILSVAQNMNTTWRSQVGSEFMTAANKTWFKSLVDVARAGGVEMGAYQLILNARSATAFNQAAPSSAAVVAASLNKGYDCLIPTEGLDTISSSSAGNASTCHVNGAHCALCGATVFYDQMDASMQEWWNVTVRVPGCHNFMPSHCSLSLDLFFSSFFSIGFCIQDFNQRFMLTCAINIGVVCSQRVLQQQTQMGPNRERRAAMHRTLTTMG